MEAWTNPLDESAIRLREETDFPVELLNYRLTALTGWTEEQRGRERESVLMDLYMIDEIVRVNDRRLLAKSIANELALILAPMFGVKIK